MTAKVLSPQKRITCLSIYYRKAARTLSAWITVRTVRNFFRAERMYSTFAIMLDVVVHGMEAAFSYNDTCV